MACWNCFGDHPVHSCELPPRNKAVAKIFVEKCVISMCYECLSFGHLARNCHRLNPLDHRRCQRCKRMGHPEWRCPMPVGSVVRGPFWTVHNLDNFEHLDIEERKRRLMVLFESGRESPFDVREIWGPARPIVPVVVPALEVNDVRDFPNEIPNLPIGWDDEWLEQMDPIEAARVRRRWPRAIENEVVVPEEDVVLFEPEAPELIVVLDSDEEEEAAGGSNAEAVATWEIPVNDMMSAMIQVMIDTADLTPNEVIAYGRRLAPNLQEACVELLRKAKEVAEKHRRL